MSIKRFFKKIMSEQSISSTQSEPDFATRLRMYDEALQRQDLDVAGNIFFDLPSRAETLEDWIGIALRSKGDFYDEIVLPRMMDFARTTPMLQHIFLSVPDYARQIREPVLHRLADLAEDYFDWKFVTLFCPEEPHLIPLLADALRKCIEIGEPSNEISSVFWKKFEDCIRTYGKTRMLVAGWRVLGSVPEYRDNQDFGAWFMMATEAHRESEAFHYFVGKMQELGTAADWHFLLERWEEGGGSHFFADLAHRELSKTADKDDEMRPTQVVDLGSELLNLNWIPPGDFEMGDVRTESGHTVTFRHGFWLGKYPVTQAQFQAVTGRNPSVHIGDDRPVESVTWHEAKEFCRVLNERFGPDAGEFRLPSEAEWEYACRAGSRDRYCFGNDHARLVNYAWFTDNSDDQTHPVGKKKPNSWGLHDMHGNVYEWCEDMWHDDYTGAPIDGSVWFDGTDDDRIDRGGHFASGANSCCCASRDGRAPADRLQFLGFRVARSMGR